MSHPLRTTLTTVLTLLACLTTLTVYTALTQTTHAAPTTCNTLTNSMSIPNGFGTSYSFFSGTKDYLLSVLCDTNAITITAGNNNPATWVYDTGYLYQNSQWTPYTLSCTGKSGSWCPKQATKTITNPPSDQYNYLVAYTCEWSDNAWKCGCQDKNCNTAAWQLQVYSPQGSGGVTPTGQGSLLNEDFESVDWADKYQGRVHDAYRESGAAAHSGQYGVRMHVDVGDHWGGEIRWEHPLKGQGGDFDEVWARYYVKFGSTYGRDEAIYVGKAGYRARSAEVCGSPCLETTDSNNLAPNGWVRGKSYYHKNVSERTLASEPVQHGEKSWDAAGDMQQGTWHCVETHIKLNTPGTGNGVYQNWMDGTLVSNLSDLKYRDSSSFDIDHSVLMFYVGGQWVSDRTMDVYFDDWAVSSERIGCE